MAIMRSLRAEDILPFGQALVKWGRDDPLATGMQAGDFGWLCRNDAAWLTARFVVWVDAAGAIVACGFREGDDGLWLQVDPTYFFDMGLAYAIADGVQEAGLHEVSGPPAPSAVRAELVRRGAVIDPELWPHLWRPLSDDDLVEIPNVASTATDALVVERIRVQRSAFVHSTFTRERWERMASGPLFRADLYLVALDEIWKRRIGVDSLVAGGPHVRRHRADGHASRSLAAGPRFACAAGGVRGVATARGDIGSGWGQTDECRGDRSLSARRFPGGRARHHDAPFLTGRAHRRHGPSSLPRLDHSGFPRVQSALVASFWGLHVRLWPQTVFYWRPTGLPS